MKTVIAAIAVSLLAAAAVQAPETQLVYSADPQDPWNRIFSSMFTRTVEVRLAEDLLGDRPFAVFPVMGLRPQFRIGVDGTDRFESGDRAIEPLYPSFLTDAGLLQVLAEPLHSQLTAALTRALEDSSARPALARALMQADVWAAHDILIRDQA